MRTYIQASFRTHYTGEAVDEINLAFQHAGYPERITEENLLETYPADEAGNDGFGDTIFVFSAMIDAEPDDIIAAFKGTPIDIEIP